MYVYSKSPKIAMTSPLVLQNNHTHEHPTTEQRQPILNILANNPRPRYTISLTISTTCSTENRTSSSVYTTPRQLLITLKVISINFSSH